MSSPISGLNGCGGVNADNTAGSVLGRITNAAFAILINLAFKFDFLTNPGSCPGFVPSSSFVNSFTFFELQPLYLKGYCWH
jgi:hypothetical protein